jgi:gliding motility-associated-like protein
VFSSHFYQWQESADGNTWTDIVGETNQTIDIIASTESFYRAKIAEVAINLGNDQCILLSDVFQIEINDSPGAPMSNGNVDFNCNLSEAILSVTVPSDITVNWYDALTDGNLLLANSLSYTATSEGIYYAEAVNNITSCISTRTVINTSILEPDAPLSDGDTDFDCALNEAVLSVSVPSGIIVNWYDLETGGVLLLANSTTYTVNNQGTYYAEAVDDITGCISMTRTAVSVSGISGSENCIIPQGISPGVSPGKNDNFDLSNFAVTKLEIYNRYGTLVYSKNDYTNEWEGQTNKGGKLPVGTYFYIMIYEGGAKKRSSWVYLNR